MTLCRILNDTAAHNKAKTHIRPCRPSVGDYVVVFCNVVPLTKMSGNIVVPRRIVHSISDLTFKIKHFLTEETSDAHATRIRPYADSLVETPVQIREIAEFSDRIWYSVDKIKDYLETQGIYQGPVA